MVLHAMKASSRAKKVNEDVFKKQSRRSGVKKVSASKKESGRLATPLCRSINTFTKRSEKTKRQAWNDESLFLIFDNCFF